jgi:hypothetical protein
MCEILKENNGKCCGACDTKDDGEWIRCKICDELRPAHEIDKDWRSPGWSVCKVCIGDGDADVRLAEYLAEHAILDDCKYMAEKYLQMVKMYENKY